MRIVQIETPDFQAKAISMAEMPVSRMVALDTPDPVKRVSLIIKLCSDAIVEESDRERFWALSFIESMKAVDNWINASPAEMQVYEGTRRFLED